MSLDQHGAVAPANMPLEDLLRGIARESRCESKEREPQQRGKCSEKSKR